MEIQRKLGLAGCVLAAVISLPMMAAAADPIAIKLATNSSGTDDDVYTIAANKFMEALEEVAPGQFEVTYYPNRQLGDEKELMQGLQLGTVDMAIVTNSTAANVAPQLAVNDLPFLYSSQKKAAEILDGPLGEQLFDALEQKNIIGLSFCESGYRQMINNAKPIETPEDVVGVKFRVMQSPLFIDMFSNLGGAAVPMAWGDTVTALQQGTVDGLENAAWTIPAFSLDEITKYLSLTNHIYTVAPLMMSKSFYGRLSSEQQEAIHEAGMLACERQRVISAQHERDIIEGLKASGKMQVNEVEDIGAFREKMAPLYEEYRDRVGSDLLDQWLAAAKG